MSEAPPYPAEGETGGGPEGVWQLPSAPPPYLETDPHNKPHEVLIVCGGWDGDQALNTVELYDSVNREWSPLPNMLAPRRDHGAAVVGDTLYVVGGWNSEPYYSTVEKFNMKNNIWSQTNCLSSPRGWPGVVALGEFIYCVGGYDEDEKALTKVERMQVGEEKWEEIQGLNEARGGCGLVAYNGYLFAIGGYNGDEPLKSVEMFNPIEGRWTFMEDMPSPREDLSHSCAVYNNSIIVMGGVDEEESPLASGLQFSPETNSWRPLQGRLLEEKRGLGLAVVGGEMIAVGGENRDDDNLEMVMKFESNSQPWQQIQSMGSRRAGHALGVMMKEPFAVGGCGFSFQM